VSSLFQHFDIEEFCTAPPHRLGFQVRLASGSEYATAPGTQDRFTFRRVQVASIDCKAEKFQR
jgi:hypothetical protein